MKLSIWQQFSSNHSSDFTIIGVFDTAEKANNAAEALRGILARIGTWHNDHPEEAQELYEQWADGDLPAMSPAEQQIAQEYGLHWVGGIDWFDGVKIRVILGHVIIVEPRRHVDYGPNPFDQIINQLGGYGLVAGYHHAEPLGFVTVSLSCLAPDAATVATILAEKEPQFPHDEYEGYQPSTLRAYDLTLIFRWDYDAGEWALGDLVAYLQMKGCTKLAYHFDETRYTRTDTFTVPSDTP